MLTDRKAAKAIALGNAGQTPRTGSGPETPGTAPGARHLPGLEAFEEDVRVSRVLRAGVAVGRRDKGSGRAWADRVDPGAQVPAVTLVPMMTRKADRPWRLAAPFV